MRTISILLLLVGFTAMAQIKGNKNIETITFPIENLEKIKVDLYAKIIIDASAKEEMTITTDSNLFKYIDTENVDGTIHFSQLKWISPSQDIVIKIGAPNLKMVEQGTHDTTEIINLNQEAIQVRALLGKIIVNGTVNAVNASAENGVVNAKGLVAKNARINIWGSGKAIINATDEVYSKLSEDARIELINQPKILKGDTKKGIAQSEKIKNQKVEWIGFKIKNNSWNRHNFVVKGPKSDGSKFGYGFPMMPGRVKKERWSVGTKVYKVNKLGLRTLLITIKAEDEGKTVKLFKS